MQGSSVNTAPPAREQRDAGVNSTLILISRLANWDAEGAVQCYAFEVAIILDRAKG